MSEDRHADDRDRKRRKDRYGHTTTNPGLRIVMRQLAQQDRDAQRAEVSADETGKKRRIRITRRRRKPRRKEP